MNGEEAVAEVKKNDFDLILMDIQMPVLDGLGATRKIRNLDKKDRESLPIIAMTAHAMAEARDQSRLSGMNDYITKPVDPDELYGILVEWIKPRRLSDDEIGLKNNVSAEDTEDAAILMPLIEGVEAGGALKRMGGNVDLYLKLLRTFTPDNKDLLLRLWEAYTKKDYETAFLLAHTLKGVAGNLGITQVYLAATDLEKSLEDGKSNVLELLKLVDKALQKAFMILESELPSKRSSKVLKQGGRQRKWDSKEVTRLCLELKQSLERHDLKAEGVLAEVASFLSEKYDEEVEGIAEEIDLLHFQEAVLRLKKLGELIHIEL